MRAILEKMWLDVQDIHIIADAERNKEKANRIEKVSLHFKITGTNLNEEKLNKAMALTKKNCPMVQSVEGSTQVTESFEIIDA